MPPAVESKPPEPQPPTMSLVARLLNVFAIPGDVFDEVRKAPPSAGNWVVPMLLLIVVGCIGAWLVYSQPAIQQQLREAQDKVLDKLVEKGTIPKEAADRQREAGGASNKIGPYFSVIASAAVTPFWWGLLIWLGGKVLKGNFPFMKGVEAAGLGNAISVLEAIITTLLCVSLSRINGAPSAALLVKDFDPQNTSHALLTLVNPITFWILAVWSIALARLSGARVVPAAAWVFGLWLAKTAFLVGIGLLVKHLLGF